MSAYIVIVARAWMNERAYGFNYSSDLKQFTQRRAAIRHGFKLCESDDFNIGTIQGGRLVATGWMDEDFPPEDDDLEAQAEQLGLAVTP